MLYVISVGASSIDLFTHVGYRFILAENIAKSENIAIPKFFLYFVMEWLYSSVNLDVRYNIILKSERGYNFK